MEVYDYKEAVLNDVLEFIEDQVCLDDWKGDRDGFAEWLNDYLWAEDSVTGNASGSYTFNTWKAEENLCHNWDLLEEAICELGCGSSILAKTVAKGAEWCDVIIRCYLLPGAIEAALDKIEEEYEGIFESDDL